MDRAEAAIRHFWYGFAFRQQYKSELKVVEDKGIPYVLDEKKSAYDFYIYKKPADQTLAQIGRISRVHGLCFFPGSEKGALQTYKSKGYRQRFTELLMQYELSDFKASRPKFKIRRASSPDEVKAMSKAKKSGRRYEVEHLENDNVHMLYAEIGGQVVGGGNLIVLPDLDAIYVEDMFTVSEHRRKGVGSALMKEMLRAGQQHGLGYCTLVAFMAAKEFYSSLGFTLVADLVFLQQKKTTRG